MVNLETKIKKILKQKQINVDFLATNIGMTKQNIYNIFKKNTITVATLEKISNFLGIPVSYFFDDVGGGDIPVIDLSLVDTDKDKKIKQLRKKIKELERKELILINALSK